MAARGDPCLQLSLVLAGVAFRVRVEGPCEPANVAARFGHYEAPPPPGEDPIDLVVTVDPSYRPPRPPRARFPAAEAVRLPDGGVRFLRDRDELTYDPRTRRARAVSAGTARGLAPVVDPTAIDTPLRLLLSYELPRREGLLVHSAGYADARGAVVFAAASGGGKTTTARKLPPDRVLSDDQVALRRIDGAWRAFALPFVGEYARATCPVEAPLAAVVLLGKAAPGQPVSLTRVTSKAAALPLVLGCVVYFVTEDPVVSALLGLGVDLVTRVPVLRLATTREAPMEPVLADLLGMIFAFGPLRYRVTGMAPSEPAADLAAFGVDGAMDEASPATTPVATPVDASGSSPGRPRALLDALAARVVGDAPAAGCVVLHAAGVRVGDGAALLVASPGTGKTTAALHAGDRAFAYNAVLVRADPGRSGSRPLAWPLPFGGGAAPLPRVHDPRPLPVSLVASLVRAEQPWFEWIRGPDATVCTLRSLVCPQPGDSNVVRRAILALDVANRVRTARLGVAPHPSYLSVLDEALKGTV